MTRIPSSCAEGRSRLVPTCGSDNEKRQDAVRHPRERSAQERAEGTQGATSGQMRTRKGASAMSATAENSFDIVILGGGSGGYACALRAAELGLSVALVEKGKLGGTCLHLGCIPTKALLHAAEVADTAREGMQFGVKSTFESVDMSGVNAYKDGVVERLYKGLQGLVKSKSIEYVQGQGALVAKDTVEVAGRQLVGKNVVLATGSYAQTPQSLIHISR